MLNENFEFIIILDLAASMHLFAVILAIGGILHTHISTLSGLSQMISEKKIREIYKTHKIVSIALLILWVSGAFILLFKYLYLSENPPEKMYVKIFFVLALTACSFGISRFLLPYIKSQKGRNLMSFSLSERMLILPFIYVSCVGWLTAASIGSMNLFIHLDVNSIIIVTVVISLFILILLFIALFFLNKIGNFINNWQSCRSNLSGIK